VWVFFRGKRGIREWAAEPAVEARDVSNDRRCLVIDAHPTVRLGVREALASRYEVEEANTGSNALELLTSVGDFDVVIVDLRREDAQDGTDLSWTATIRALRKAQPGLGIVAHGAHAQRHAVREAMRAGATAYVVKSSPLDALSQAVDAAAQSERFVDPAAADRTRGRPVLTQRQRQILQLYADGQSTARVAKRLGLSAETVRTHTKAILSRLGARDRVHAVAIALRSALIE
jgi:DNA-binding NarL/FixJ family response regulator